jgi:thymidylate synthase (FAD)
MMVRFDDICRGFTHELVRHRIASYTQESTRYVDESDFHVVIPSHKDPDEKFVELTLPNRQRIKVSFREWMELNEQMYKGLRKAGWVTQDARQVLPIGIKAQIVITANFREWRHIFKLRCAKNAHWEIRRVMVNLLREIQKIVPVVFDDFQINEEDDSKGYYAIISPQ